MPFLETKAAGLPVQIEDGRRVDEIIKPNFMNEVLPAAFETENTVGSAHAYMQGEVPAFDDRKAVPNESFEQMIMGYEGYAASFVEAETYADFNSIKRNIDRERQNRQVLDDAGAAGFAAILGASIIDPITLIPGATFVRGVTTGARVATIGATSAASGAAAVAGAEIALHSTQETRTPEESYANIAAAAILTGILGTGGGIVSEVLRSKPLSSVEKGIKDDLSQDVHYTDDSIVTVSQGDLNKSVGAAQVDKTTIEQETLESALGLEKGLAFQDPVLRSSVSPSIAARRHMQGLAETPLTYKKNTQGISNDVPVESLVKQWQYPLASALAKTDDMFVQYRKGRDRKSGDVLALGVQDQFLRNTNKLTRSQFYEEIGKAMRRGDVHEIDEVQKAAQTMRREVFDPLKERAIEANLLSEDVKVITADSYLTRLYNQELIVARRPEFELRIVNWLRKEQGELEEAEMIQIARDVTDNILGQGGGRILYEPFLVSRGPLKERVLNIPDVEIEDFLESNIETVARAYTRTMAPDVELKSAFGDIEMKGQLGEIDDDYQDLLAKANTEKQRKKLDSRRKRDKDDLAAVRDRIRGTYGLPSTAMGISWYKAGRILKNLNYVRLLGGMTLSAIPDVARPVMIHGVRRTFGTAMIPLTKGLKGMKLSAQETKMAGTALDMQLDTRAMSIADIADDYGRGSRFDRVLEKLSQNFGLVTLMAPWNAAMKQFFGVISQTRTLQEVQNWSKGSITQANRTRLASLGIDQKMAIRISGEFSENGQEVDGVLWANTGAWSDQEAVKVYRAALAKEVDKGIVTPGQDKSLWMSTPLGSVVSQFKSFGVASTQRVMLSGLQKRDADTLNGMLLMISLGMLTTAVKNGVSDRPNPDELDQWIAEGIDRSGLTGWFFDANNVVEKVTRGAVGASAITGGSTMSRYQSRNIAGALAGPSVDIINDAARIIGSSASGEWSQADTRAVRKLLPYQNLFYTRELLNEAEKGVNEALGVRK